MCVLSQPAIAEYTLMLVAGYYDESADEFEDWVYTVAGYTAPGRQASIFELRWAALLKKWNLAYFKASEIEAGFGEFAQYRDDLKNLKLPLTKREKDLIRTIKIEFVDLICKEPDLWGFSATVNLRDYKLLKIQEPDLAQRIPKPYYLCGQLVMVETGYHLAESNSISPSWAKGLLRPIFDSHNDYSRTMIDSFKEFSEKNPESSRYMLPPLYEKEQTYLCLQAADCLAFESRKFAFNSEHDAEREPRKAFLRLMEHVRTAYYLDYEALKHIASSQDQPDIQPIEPIIRNS